MNPSNNISQRWACKPVLHKFKHFNCIMYLYAWASLPTESPILHQFRFSSSRTNPPFLELPASMNPSNNFSQCNPVWDKFKHFNCIMYLYVWPSFSAASPSLHQDKIISSRTNPPFPELPAWLSPSHKVSKWCACNSVLHNFKHFSLFE